MRLYSDIQNMDPAFILSQNDWVVGDCVTGALVRYGPNSYDIVYDLAEEVKQVDGQDHHLQAVRRPQMAGQLRRGDRRGCQVLLRAHRRPRS